MSTAIQHLYHISVKCMYTHAHTHTPQLILILQHILHDSVLLTIFSVSAIYVFFCSLWREENPYFTWYSDAFLWRTLILAGSYFGLSKQSCRRRVFTFLHDPFMEATKVWLVTCERTVKKTLPPLPSTACLPACPPPPLHTLYTLRSLKLYIIHTLPHNMQCCVVALLSTRTEAQRGTPLTAWRRMINKRLWSTTQKLKYSDEQTHTFQAALWPGKAKKGSLLLLTLKNSFN